MAFKLMLIIALDNFKKAVYDLLILDIRMSKIHELNCIVK